MYLHIWKPVLPKIFESEMCDSYPNKLTWCGEDDHAPCGGYFLYFPGLIYRRLKHFTKGFDHRDKIIWCLQIPSEGNCVNQHCNKKCPQLQPVEMNTIDRNTITEAMEEDADSRSGVLSSTFPLKLFCKVLIEINKPC
ncbi:uncharacterized protein [Aphelocoma coerulescens]|uniref:uncharacterized protein isoform X8 n=1 Tax=Aphelocoma coerulescens TaxID=39617 RepID=UPI003604EBE8